MKRIAFVLPLVFLCGHAWAQGEGAPQQPVAPSERPAAQPSAAAGGSALYTYDESEARRLFRELDVNGDGHLSTAELAADRSNQGNWVAVDRNGDGRITADEFTAIKR